ncbi:MAG: nucleoside deaminase [Saprospiraceae bacterium]|nr:nucleoside deaminase [Saprospiraceae bacterium]
MLSIYTDEHFMKMALAEAKKAALAGEIPIGAVLVHQNKVLAKSHNQTELLQDVTAHAEILAITSGTEFLGSKYLKNCTLYVTLEPCPMCAGALKWSQLSKIVYAAEDEKNGFMKYGKDLLHPKTHVEYGLLSEESSALLKKFFESKRKNLKSKFQ